MAQKGIIKNSTAADVGAPELASVFQSIIGSSGIMKVYSDLAATKVNNNSVSLAAGVYNLSGYLLEIAKGTTVALAIDSGTAGQNRNDIIAAEFVRNGGGVGIDTLLFKVIKGTSTSGTPTDPTLTQQDINATGVTRQEAVHRVKIVGTTLTTIETVASILETVQTLDTSVVALTPIAGTWTPTLKGSTTAGTATYARQLGKYYKIGKLVYIVADMQVSALTGGAGYYQVGGLPFAPATAVPDKHYVTAASNITGAGNSWDAYGPGIWLRDATGLSAVAYGDISTAKNIHVTGCYMTA